MITKRIIPCLDVKDGRVVKGVNFQRLGDVASPVELAKYYSENGADELVFYDITASAEGRSLFTEILTETARTVFIPLTVGGGINTTDDFDRVLKCGADKVFRRNPGSVAGREGREAVRRPVRGAERRRETRGRRVQDLCQGRQGEHGNGGY